MMGRSDKWMKYRLTIISRDNYQCVRCGADYKDRIKIGKFIEYKSNLVVDHILPLKLGGAEFEDSNVQTLCTFCNKKKNAWDQSLIAKKKRLDNSSFNHSFTVRKSSTVTSAGFNLVTPHTLPDQSNTPGVISCFTPGVNSQEDEQVRTSNRGDNSLHKGIVNTLKSKSNKRDGSSPDTHTLLRFSLFTPEVNSPRNLNLSDQEGGGS